MSDGKIRIGIIGAGWWAVGKHWKRLEKDDRVEVTAICRRNEELLAEASKVTGVNNTYTDWRKMLENEDLNAVLVCTPNNYHAEPTIAALQKDLQVLVEKPRALSITDAEAMTKAAKASAGHLMVGYNRRREAVWREVVEGT